MIITYDYNFRFLFFLDKVLVERSEMQMLIAYTYFAGCNQLHPQAMKSVEATNS